MEEHYLLVNVLPKIVSDTRSTAHVFYFHAPKAAFDADPEAAALLEAWTAATRRHGPAERNWRTLRARRA